MNILIIGGAGGIGSELLKDLSNDEFEQHSCRVP